MRYFDGKSKQKTIQQLMEESKERNDKLYEEYLNGNNDYKKLAEKYGITYDNVKKIIYRRNKKNRNN
ncbi:MAG: Mor transcription activator family protein [Bacilli bacterium]